MDRDCGGCQGLGSHWRWCPEVVGFAANHWGVMSERIGSMADSVGGNNPGAANHLYAASALLREMANDRKAEHQENR